VPFATGYIQYEAPASEVYINLDYDPSSVAFKMIDTHFEKPDGESGVFEGIRFAILPLENALLNKEQDEPGYWDRVLGDDDEFEVDDDDDT